MNLRHEQSIRSDLGYISSDLSTALKGGELSKSISFAGPQPTSLAAILQVLGRLTCGHKWIKYCPASEFGWSFNDTMTTNSDIIMEDDVLTDDRVRTDIDVVSKFR